MPRSALALISLLAALCVASARRLTPEELCASTSIDQRRALNVTAFVACYNKTVWDLLTCPPGFRFVEALQSCVPRTGVSWVPAPQADPNATAVPSIFLYAWAGNDHPGPRCPDAVVVIDGTPESATFGKVLNVAYTPTWGNEPHHVGLSNNTWLAVGGIQAYLNGNPDIYIFNTTQPDAPTFFKAVDPPLSAVTDSFSAQADGGFWVSQMGNATGGTPGRIVRLGRNFEVVKEYPDAPPPGFNPHGFAIDATRQRMVTADYLELQSTITGESVNASYRGDGVTQYRSTLRVWQLPEFTLAGEFDAGDQESDGFMTVQFVGSTGVAVSGSGKGVLWALNVTDPVDARPAHFIGANTSSCVMVPLAFSGGTRFFVTALGLSLVQLVDTSNPRRWRVLQEIYLPRGTFPHAVTATRNGNLLAVSTYYLNQVARGKPFGSLRQMGTRQIYFFDVINGGNGIRLNPRVPVIDFKDDVNKFRGDCTRRPCGLWRPHGMVFKTNPTPVSVPPRGQGCPQPVKRRST